jgi:DNA-binding protein HU-beta
MPKAAQKKSAAGAKSAKAVAPVTVTLKQMAAELAERHQLSKKQSEAMLADLVILTARHLKKGARLRLSGLGILQVRHRAARMGRNPATGEAIKIKTSKKIAFRPAKELKDESDLDAQHPSSATVQIHMREQPRIRDRPRPEDQRNAAAARIYSPWPPQVRGLAASCGDGPYAASSFNAP